MIEVTPNIAIDENGIELRFVRASGPGGQNVNKVSSAVQLRFDIAQSPSLSVYVKERMRQIGGRRVTREGVLVIDAQRHRSQELNRADAIDRLVELIREAAKRRAVRRPTRVPRSAQLNRLKEKSKRSGVKRTRSDRGTEE